MEPRLFGFFISLIVSFTSKAHVYIGQWEERKNEGRREELRRVRWLTIHNHTRKKNKECDMKK